MATNRACPAGACRERRGRPRRHPAGRRPRSSPAALCPNAIAVSPRALPRTTAAPSIHGVPGGRLPVQPLFCGLLHDPLVRCRAVVPTSVTCRPMSLPRVPPRSCARRHCITRSFPPVTAETRVFASYNPPPRCLNIRRSRKRRCRPSPNPNPYLGPIFESVWACWNVHHV